MYLSEYHYYEYELLSNTSLQFQFNTDRWPLLQFVANNCQWCLPRDPISMVITTLMVMLPYARDTFLSLVVLATLVQHWCRCCWRKDMRWVQSYTLLSLFTAHSQATFPPSLTQTHNTHHTHSHSHSVTHARAHARAHTHTKHFPLIKKCAFFNLHYFLTLN